MRRNMPQISPTRYGGPLAITSCELFVHEPNDMDLIILYYRARDYRTAKQGIHKRMWCSQAATHAKAPKHSQNPDVKRRETVGMDRFDCAGALSIRIKPNPWADNLHMITITIVHKQGHIRYLDVRMPQEAHDHIKAQLHLTPGLIASQLVETFPDLTQAQVYAAWSRLSETYWKKDDDQIGRASCRERVCQYV